MCMQNCVPTFQSLVVKREFAKDVLVRMLNPKYNLPVDIQNRILRFIMTWSNGLNGAVDVTELKELYLEMVKKRIQFPSTETNEESQFAAPENCKLTSPCPVSGQPVAYPESAAQHLSPEQMGKLYSELDLVKMNVTVMSAILVENKPGTENPEDMHLLQELHKTCQEMQKRIMQLLETVQNDDVVVELVQVNDDLNNVFLRYDRFSRNRVNQPAEHTKQAALLEVNNNWPSAPSKELLYIDCLSAGLGTQIQTNGSTLPAVQFPEPVVASSTAQIWDGEAAPTPSIYPQMDLLELSEAVDTPFVFGVQSNIPRVAAPRQLYENIYSSPTLLLPTVPTLHPTSVPLQNEPRHKPSLNSNSDDTNKNSALPNYYELLEFDPLIQSNGTEVIYEEIDPSLWVPEAKKSTNC
ncbi:hypothetical protein FKM82_007917 [Ascaphus truei]